jgi:uncharacterized protein involved in response to NO
VIGQWQVGRPRPTRSTGRRTSLGGERRPQSEVIEDAPDDSRILDQGDKSFAVHALTVGAIGGLTLGMMTRTARGHSGRPPVVDGFELAMFLLVQAAAIVRVFGGMASPGQHMASVQLSGLLWAAAFGLYAVRYWPVLTRPRLDDRPG